jgi:hypothetical protein
MIEWDVCQKNSDNSCGPGLILSGTIGAALRWPLWPNARVRTSKALILSIILINVYLLIYLFICFFFFSLFSSIDSFMEITKCPDQTVAKRFLEADNMHIQVIWLFLIQFINILRLKLCLECHSSILCLSRDASSAEPIARDTRFCAPDCSFSSFLWSGFRNQKEIGSNWSNILWVVIASWYICK